MAEYRVKDNTEFAIPTTSNPNYQHSKPNSRPYGHNSSGCLSKFWSEKVEKVATVDIYRQFIDIEMSIGESEILENDRCACALDAFRLYVDKNCAFYLEFDRVCLTNQHPSSDMRMR